MPTIAEYLNGEMVSHLFARDLIKRQSKGIKRITIRCRYKYKLTNVHLIHKRTGVDTLLDDINLRATATWVQTGWLKDPDGRDQYVLATTKHGKVYPCGGKYPCSPGLAMPGSGYYMHATLIRIEPDA